MSKALNTKVLALILALLISVPSYALSGKWSGDLVVGQMKLKLVFNFSEGRDGATHCSLGSPSQGATDIPTELTLCTSDSISLTCASIGAVYSGRISGQSITGVFSQRGYSFPLELKPQLSLCDRRPQTPVPPFPYVMADTAFAASDGAVMSATLTMPVGEDSRKIPFVVMVTGSGPQNRDEELYDHRPFAVIADYLARNGIGSLRYDDRGTGRSTGNFLTATTETFKDDARSGISLLRELPQAGKIGVLGHSEGGTIAFMLGADGSADFIVSLAGMALTGKEALMKQNSHALDPAGISGAEKENNLKFIGLVFDAIAEQNRNHISRPIDVDSIVCTSGLSVDPQIIASVKMTQRTLRTPWFDAFINLDPRDFLSAVKCPVLALNGDNDTQVDGRANLAQVKECVPQADVRLLPALNHLMQHSVSGETGEYYEIRETISPEVLAIISDFINSLTDAD